jgi:two-component system NarL family sensor kinase
MERRMRGEEVQLRLVTIIELTPTLVATADADGVMLYLNAAGRVMIGLEPGDDLAHMTLADCHAPHVREHFTREALTVAAGSGVWHGESVLLASDGREVTVSQVVIAHRDIEGNLEGFSIAARDLTEWLRAKELLRKSEAEIHLATQEIERQRIAADLHDGLGQTLSLLKLSIENAARRLSDGLLDETAEALGRLVPMAKDAMAEVRRIAMDLRPSTLDDLGILPTMSWFFREFEASCPGVRVEREFDAQESDVPVPLKLVIFRILQEAVSNATKHAHADRIRVRLRTRADELQFSIEDNGKGFDVEAMASLDRLPRGLGLKSMRERAELSGGIYDIESAPGQGTRIAIAWRQSAGALATSGAST